MVNIVFNIFFELANLLLVISLLLTFIKFFKNKLPNNFAFLLLYLVISSVEYLIFELNRFSILIFFDNQKLVDLFFALIHFLLLAFFILTEIKMKRKIILYFLYYSIGSIILVLIYFDFIKSSYYSVTVSNLGLIIFSTLYFNSLMRTEHNNYIGQSSSFYIISGLFLGTSMLLPIILFGLYLKSILNPDAFLLISILAPISSILMYSFFIKALLLKK